MKAAVPVVSQCIIYKITRTLNPQKATIILEENRNCLFHICGMMLTLGLWGAVARLNRPNVRNSLTNSLNQITKRGTTLDSVQSARLSQPRAIYLFN